MKDKPYNLEERTFQFARNVSLKCRQLEKNESNLIYTNQVIRSASSIGANYREANECLGKKDFLMRLRIARKEAKESEYWLRLIKETNDNPDSVSDILKEAKELKLIFSSIIEKVKD